MRISFATALASRGLCAPAPTIDIERGAAFHAITAFALSKIRTGELDHRLARFVTLIRRAARARSSAR